MLYVPKLTNNLFSVHAATSKGNTVLFGHTDRCIKNKHGKVIATGSPSGKFHLLDCETHQMPTEKLEGLAVIPARVILMASSCYSTQRAQKELT